MAETTSNKTYYFTDSFIVAPESLAFLYEHLKEPPWSLRTRVDFLDGDETNFISRELLELWPTLDLPKVKMIVVFVSAESTSGFFQFVNVNKASLMQIYVPSWLHIESSRPEDIFLLRGLRDALEESFGAKSYFSKVPHILARGKLTSAQFKIPTASQLEVSLPVKSTNPRSTKPLASDAAEEPRGRSVLADRKWLIGAIIAVVTLGVSIYFGERQSSSSESQARGQNTAVFTFKKLPADYSASKPQEYLSKGVTPFDALITNVGKATATNVAVRCGFAEEHGPYAQLGTISSDGGHVEIHSQLSDPHIDLLHSGDSACYSPIFLIYDDWSGHKFVRFDVVGNAIPAND